MSSRASRNSTPAAWLSLNASTFPISLPNQNVAWVTVHSGPSHASGSNVVVVVVVEVVVVVVLVVVVASAGAVPVVV